MPTLELTPKTYRHTIQLLKVLAKHAADASDRNALFEAALVLEELRDWEYGVSQPQSDDHQMRRRRRKGHRPVLYGKGETLDLRRYRGQAQ